MNKVSKTEKQLLSSSVLPQDESIETLDPLETAGLQPVCEGLWENVLSLFPLVYKLLERENNL